MFTFVQIQSSYNQNINLLMDDCHCSLIVTGTALSRDMEINFLFFFFFIWYLYWRIWNDSSYYLQMIPTCLLPSFYSACILPSHGSNMQSLKFFLTINSRIKLKVTRQQVFSPLELSQRSTRIRFVSDNTYSARDTHIYICIFLFDIHLCFSTCVENISIYAKCNWVVI